MHKNRPDWQAGKINGLGGKIEPGEDNAACIVREIEEEAGLVTKPEEWLHICAMQDTDWRVDVLGLIWKEEIASAKAKTDEQIEWFEAQSLPPTVIPNLHWLIPLAIHKLSGNIRYEITA